MRPLVVASLAVAAVAFGQAFRSRPDNVVVRPDDVMNTYHLGPYNATTGSLFDAGYQVNSLGTNAYPASIEGAQALVAAECEARMLRNGVNNALSNVFSLEDDRQGRRMTTLVMESAALDAGVVVSQSAGAIGKLYWRALSGGDAGMPWMAVNALGASAITYLVNQSAGTIHAGLAMSAFSVAKGNGGAVTGGNADSWAPGYYCFIPVGSPGYGVSHVWVRLNRVFEPR